MPPRKPSTSSVHTVRLSTGIAAWITTTITRINAKTMSDHEADPDPPENATTTTTHYTLSEYRAKHPPNASKPTARKSRANKHIPNDAPTEHKSQETDTSRSTTPSIHRQSQSQSATPSQRNSPPPEEAPQKQKKYKPRKHKRGWQRKSHQADEAKQENSQGGQDDETVAGQLESGEDCGVGAAAVDDSHRHRLGTWTDLELDGSTALTRSVSW
ncbi:uncharacterized protein AB675_11423 [Cyphellophora attinorum]|uniref:Uncharacterized protein n=1 Tax=Cyphellophora attinorum TaxID=1664694 RepID=A0A0N1H936_9EURO|nr:uncharacterized protein AB675_11423 [Phialophora attinorum]KPI40010.1 hypothetical protein AB675_11423 [Phialophora attinorum]